MKKASKIKESLQHMVGRFRQPLQNKQGRSERQPAAQARVTGLDLWHELQRPSPQLPIEQVILTYHQYGHPLLAGRIYTEFRHLVLGVALRLLDDRAAAEDATADVFVKVLERLRKELPHNFPGWLYTVTRYHCFELRRKAQAGPVFEPLSPLRQFSDDTPAAVDTEARNLLVTDTVQQAIARLPHSQQRCIEQFFIHGSSYKEIAARLGMSTNDVKSHIQNGKRRLAAILLPLRDRLLAEF